MNTQDNSKDLLLKRNKARIDDLLKKLKKANTQVQTLQDKLNVPPKDKHSLKVLKDSLDNMINDCNDDLQI